ncbi:uncharacterized protein LOC124360206 isoform X2 [Homalodisca vitripennis]|uniref:uncharacterized protein LOC124360206 isoform X2 n=1 Tax=Homalodisca vitripennis TaxID=197043 RepID=UPI001EEB4BC3|nr:uncharacterized protein LOC124360206 isoform X2 [Homalodisca vitripennis]
MSNRIQKLLFSEYSDFEDIVLVESPFAETNRHGTGIRQVQIGLTPTKLILASYFVETLEGEEKPRLGRDPDIESFELVSAYPVECVNLSVFRHRRRQTLKARFCNGKVLYFEIGGWQERKMLWSVWCERIKFLAPYETGTSVSETSVASSSSSGSLYIVRSSLSVSQTGQPTLWCHYASSQATNTTLGSWADPHLYLGPAFFEKGINFMTLPEIGKINKKRFRKRTDKNKRRPLFQPLALSPELEAVAREAIELWESQRRLVPKVRRRYGFSPFPMLLEGLGLCNLSKPQAFSLQKKKSVSLVHLTTPIDTDIRPVPPRPVLARTDSLESLAVPALCPDKLFQLSEDRPVPNLLEFWEPGGECMIKRYQKQYKVHTRHFTLSRKEHNDDLESERDSTANLSSETKEGVTTTNTSNRTEDTAADNKNGSGDSCGSQCHLQLSVNRQMKEDKSRFSSSGLAHQLTMIDKQLLLQLTTLELGRLQKDASTRRTPRLRSMMSFSNRIVCLVVSNVLSGTDIKARAVRIVKFVGVAYKCHQLHNLQSTVSVLRGLQSPPVYRLHRSWAYARRHHASKYRRFEDLSKRYLDPRLPLYQKTYDNLTATPPFLPCVTMLVAVLLGRLSELPQVKSTMFQSDCSTSCLPTPSVTQSSMPKPLRKFLSAFSIYPPPVKDIPQLFSCQSETHLHALSREILLENLDKFFAPVTVSCPSRRQLEDLQYFLETSQGAASRYAIPANPRVRSFLLNEPHDTIYNLFSLSKQIEPSE